jgi:hypothetical protein
VLLRVNGVGESEGIAVNTVVEYLGKSRSLIDPL